MTNFRFQDRSAFPLIVAAVLTIAGCDRDQATSPVMRGRTVLPQAPSQSWADAGSCVIGIVDGSWGGTPVPTSGVACGITWNMYYPPQIRVPSETVFFWQDNIAPGELGTKFITGLYYDIQNGPIEVSFSSPVANVKVELSYIDMGGHYMTALGDQGQELARATFSSSNFVDTQVLAVQGIRKVILYPVLGSQAPSGDWYKADQVWYRMSYELGPQGVQVSCTPTVTRGATVVCTTSLTNPAPYTVVLRQSTGAGFTVDDSSRVSHLKGELDYWQGEAVATSDVTVQVDVTDNTGTSRMSNATLAHFAVQNRPWPIWKLTTGTEQIGLVPGHITEYPTPNVSDWGVFQVDFPIGDSLMIPVARPSLGPNAGIAYVKNPIVVNSFLVGLHPALYKPGTAGVPQIPQSIAWYNDQNAKGSGTCKANDVSTLLKNVKRHEGIGLATNSHAGVANQQFALLRPDTLLERIYTPKPGRAVLDSVDAIMKSFDDSVGPYHQAQKAFDSPAEYQLAASAGINCVFDYNLSDQ